MSMHLKYVLNKLVKVCFYLFKSLYYELVFFFFLKAYLSFIRYYASFSREWKYLFHVKNLHRGHVAKSFGLKSLPDESSNHAIKERQGTFASLSKKSKK